MALKQDATKHFAEVCKRLYAYLLSANLPLEFFLDKTAPLSVADLQKYEREFTAELLNNHNTFGDVVRTNQEIVKQWFWPWLDEADPIQPTPGQELPTREELIKNDRLADIELLELWLFYTKTLRRLMWGEEWDYEAELNVLQNRMEGNTVGEPMADRADTSTGDPTRPDLPEALNAPDAEAILQRAVEVGLCDEGYNWLKSKRLLAWFANAVSERLNLGKGITADGRPRTSWRPFEILFKQKGLATTLADLRRVGEEPADRDLVDEVLK